MFRVFSHLMGSLGYSTLCTRHLSLAMSSFCLQIAERDGMLDVMYSSFEKARVAGFAKHLAAAARAGDAFSASIFHEAGTLLGSMARTLAPHLLADGGPLLNVNMLDIVCVGA